MTDIRIPAGQSLVISNQGRQAIKGPAWNGPTAELPLYRRGQARPAYGRPALVADERPIPRATARKAWRPDLWPVWKWAPLLALPSLAAVLIALSLLHILATVAN